MKSLGLLDGHSQVDEHRDAGVGAREDQSVCSEQWPFLWYSGLHSEFKGHPITLAYRIRQQR